MRYGFGVHGERPLYVRGLTYFIITLYRDGKPIRSWLRFTLNSARNKGAREARKAERRGRR